MGREWARHAREIDLDLLQPLPSGRLTTRTVFVCCRPYVPLGNGSLLNPAFAMKMLLLLVGMALTATLQRPLVTDAGFWDASGGRQLTAKAMAILSIAVWSCIVFAGRWIAYVSAY